MFLFKRNFVCDVEGTNNTFKSLNILTRKIKLLVLSYGNYVLKNKYNQLLSFFNVKNIYFKVIYTVLFYLSYLREKKDYIFSSFLLTTLNRNYHINKLARRKYRSFTSILYTPLLFYVYFFA